MTGQTCQSTLLCVSVVSLNAARTKLGWKKLCCMQGAIICGIAITTIISWIPGHAASYLGPGSNLPGECHAYIYERLPQTTKQSSLFSLGRRMPCPPHQGSVDQHRQEWASTMELLELSQS